MFTPLSAEQIIARLPRRAVAVKRLDKLPPLPAAYLSFVQQCESVEITPGIRLWDYPTALNENRRLGSDYPEVAARYWLIGDAGQGDTWFIGKESGNILFYDHDQGEYDEAEARFADMASVLFPSCKRPFFCKSLKGCSMRNRNSASQYRMRSKPGWIPLHRVCMSGIRLHIGRQQAT